MELSIRKFCTFEEAIRIDQHRLANEFRHVIVAAVIKNPWYGREFVKDLKPVIAE